VDTIVDVVGTLLGVEILGIEKVFSSPVPLGRGLINGAHGQIPLPAPATVALLEGVPVVGTEFMTETVTPTGAALLTSLATSFGPIPAMKLQSIGYGAGGRDLPIPNILRMFIGDQHSASGSNFEPLVLLETNIDDLNPEFYDYVIEKIFAAGALDVYMTPIQMKKNRPGTQLNALCQQQDSEKIKDIMFLETSTLGIREKIIHRHALTREVRNIETPWGIAQVKVAQLPNGKYKFAPEYEDCRRLAQQHKVPLREIYNTIIKAAHHEFS
jgi:uncharacterized protein (TIGR00299 family) protein